MNKIAFITVRANPDLDDCLAGAVAQVVDAVPALSGWDLCARFSDERDHVTLEIPAWAAEDARAAGFEVAS